MAAPPSLLDDGQPSSGSPLSIGEVVCGKYRIERQIGRGGMGIVLAATHLHLGHLVAIKVMRRDLLPDDRALDRLLAEARAAARVRSDHVARVLDVGTLESGSPFIVMEYLDGENLADLLDRQGALGLDEAASFLMQSCLALAEVHAAGMIHRDLKPGNIFIARQLDGSATVKIVDFGISKHIGDARERGAVTSPQVLGSPFYMSPEQMRADSVDERSDIWGLGAILFEMLTGRPPFLGDTLPEVYAAVLSHAAPHIDALRPGVPVELDEVVQRCLEKEPAHRYRDVAEVAAALAPFAGHLAGAAERVARILSSPDVSRARYSLAPDGSLAELGAERPSLLPLAAPGEGGVAPRLDASGLHAASSLPAFAGSPSPALAGAGLSEAARRALDLGAPPRTLLERDPQSGVAPQRFDVSWPTPGQVGASANTGELSSLAATGARARSLRGSRGRGVFVFIASAAAIVGAAALLWPRAEAPEPPAAGAVPAEVGSSQDSERAGRAAGEGSVAAAPRVTRLSPSAAEPSAAEPSVAEPGAAGSSPPSPAEPVAAAPGAGSAPVVEVRALRPPPRAQPVASRAAAAPSRPTSTDPASTLWAEADEPPAPEPAASPRPASEGADPSTAASGARRPLSTPDDAWNPEAFGDRR